ncbi:hypothetical protein [Pedobacter psychroterrae]|uniref:Uncharacterized protein n=1 Tax=Pedobacter psychroterrae TaxID=2530453 RepID=A0A4R0NBS0_9SPHI|nr:hypothetical protein [Pedobacter psychroterrae]TCC96733.1 hypothetical protein EZ437_21130 [Pedobacter psychroterrae]
MQDKEFDQLFRDKFEDAEIEPSANLWGNIAQELEPRKKRVLPIYWMAAAVAIVAVSVGLLMPEKETIRLQGSDFATTTSVTEPVVKPENAGITTDKSSDENVSKSTPLVIAPRLTAADVEKDFVAMQPKVSKVHPVNMEPEIVQSVVSQIVNEAAVPEADIVIASANVPDESNAITETETAERKGIRNVGDIVNYVVDKVDKREKKFLKFNTDDDDNSSLVAINIGILRFNKRSDK